MNPAADRGVASADKRDLMREPSPGQDHERGRELSQRPWFRRMARQSLRQHFAEPGCEVLVHTATSGQELVTGQWAAALGGH
jgi:hypothetical protein